MFSKCLQTKCNVISFSWVATQFENLYQFTWKDFCGRLFFSFFLFQTITEFRWKRKKKRRINKKKNNLSAIESNLKEMLWKISLQNVRMSIIKIFEYESTTVLFLFISFLFCYKIRQNWLFPSKDLYLFQERIERIGIIFSISRWLPATRKW